MNYVNEGFELALLQFGPANAEVREISYREVAKETYSEPYWWALRPFSALRRALVDADMMAAFARVKESEHPEIIGYHEDDKVIAVVSTPDSHLFVASMGFRYFLITFRKTEVGIQLVTDEAKAPISKTTG